MTWHFSSDAPIYSQLVSRFKEAIASSELAPGERLRSVRELAVDAGVNPNTMQRALSELEREGLMYSQRTSGRFVTEDENVIAQLKQALARNIITEFLNSILPLGYTVEAVISMLKENSKNGHT